MVGSRTLWEEKLRCQLKEVPYPDPVLTELCVEHYTVIKAVPPIFGYVVPASELGLAVPGYLFVIFVKTPGTRHMMVSEHLYPSKTLCGDKLKYYLRQSPLFMFSRRFLF